jgi:Cyclin, N-terminal domain/Cyclin, C-terminal domain
MEDTTMTLGAMLSQEETAYVCREHILQDSHHDPRWLALRATLANQEDLVMNRAFRSTMIAWAHHFADFMTMRRETIEFAASFFDRFLHTSSGRDALKDRVTFQLAFVTSMYMAIKLHEATAMSPRVFSKLSQGSYCIKQIERMERVILNAIQWRVNPPTATAFVREILSLLPQNVLPQELENAVYDLAKVQVELVLGDYRFVTMKKSTVALASIVNALESLQQDTNLLGIALAHHTNMLNNYEEIDRIRRYLYQVIAGIPSNPCFSSQAGSPYCRSADMANSHATGTSQRHSPRSVCSLQPN